MEDKYLIKELRKDIYKLQERVKYLTEVVKSYGGIADKQAEIDYRRAKKADNKKRQKKQYLASKNKKKVEKLNKVKVVIPWEQRYEHPKWRHRSQQIKQRDNFKCTECGDNNRLEVHHKVYQPGFEVWEYIDDYLTTLCNVCHSKFHDKHPGKELVNYGTPIKRYTDLN